jgi:hypothetical protein
VSGGFAGHVETVCWIIPVLEYPTPERKVDLNKASLAPMAFLLFQNF